VIGWGDRCSTRAVGAQGLVIAGAARARREQIIVHIARRQIVPNRLDLKVKVV
jgi:hypothetical protein